MGSLFDPEKIRAVYEAQAAIDDVVRRRKLQTPEHREVARRFHEAIHAVWPPEVWTALEAPPDDRRNLDVLLRFLEEDPFFFRSGYVKEKAVGRIGGFALSPEDRRRISAIVLQAVDRPAHREFRRQCRLARLADRTTLASELRRRLDSSDAPTAWRAYCAARGMLGMRHPQGHLRDRLSSRLGKDAIARLSAADEAQRKRNHVDMAAMRERLRDR